MRITFSRSESGVIIIKQIKIQPEIEVLLTNCAVKKGSA